MSAPPDYSPPPNPGDTLRRVLVIKLGAMGDFMQALGAFRVVRATHPSARITLLTTPPYEAFAKACPFFDIVEADGRT
jgi:ADP-heptose:LPS heptosyltransferase